jgi:hypothetical protein
VPHYIVKVFPGASPQVIWTFVGFVPKLGAAEPTPVYENGMPGDNATVNYFIARAKGGVSLYSVSWSPASM